MQLELSSITKHAFSYIVCLQLPSAYYFEYKTSEEDTRPASSFDKDGEDAIPSSGNNGDRLMQSLNPSLVYMYFWEVIQ